jgi:hypothetical protein
MNIIGMRPNPFKIEGPTEVYNKDFKKDGEGSEEDFPSPEDIVQGSPPTQLELDLQL